MVHKVSLKNQQNIQNGILHLFLENISKTPFENNLFDKIYTVNTIYFWNEPDKCFSEIKRIINITENNGMKIIKTIEIQKNKSYCIISS